jgi:hypothetical protein
LGVTLLFDESWQELQSPLVAVSVMVISPLALRMRISAVAQLTELEPSGIQMLPLLAE